MCTKADEVYGLGINFSVNRAEVSSDIDAPASLVRMMQGMILEERAERILLKNSNTLVGFFLFRSPHFPVTCVKIAVEKDPHSGR